MSEERHSPLAIHPIPEDESAELLRRRDIIRRSKRVAVVALVVLALRRSQPKKILHHTPTVIRVSPLQEAGPNPYV